MTEVDVRAIIDGLGMRPRAWRDYSADEMAAITAAAMREFGRPDESVAQVVALVKGETQ